MADAVRLSHQEQLTEYRKQKKLQLTLEAHPEESPVAIVLSGISAFTAEPKSCCRFWARRRRLSAVFPLSLILWENRPFLGRRPTGKRPRKNLQPDFRNHGIIRRFFAILGTSNGVRTLAQELVHYKMGEVLLYVGERLSYPEERVFSRPACELTAYEGGCPVLSVLSTKKRRSLQRPTGSATPRFCVEKHL